MLHGPLGLTKKLDGDASFYQKDESMHPLGVPTIFLIPTHMGGQKESYMGVKGYIIQIPIGYQRFQSIDILRLF